MAKLYYIAPIEFECSDNPITVGDNKQQRECPHDGEILGSFQGPCLCGSIQDAGTGAGTYTEVQVHNIDQARDYFTSEPQYRVDDKDANGRAPLVGGQLCLHPSFRQGEWLRLDVDGIPGGLDSRQLTLTLICGFWREVD